MYGGCGTDESTVTHRTLIHLNYMEAVSECVSDSVCAFVSAVTTSISMFVGEKELCSFTNYCSCDEVPIISFKKRKNI